ncbi:MAG: hypothetical protein ACRC33_25140 [Gemmataceae bacterium]
MTAREMFLVRVALAAVAGGILFVGYAFIWSPLADAHERRTKAGEEFSKKDTDLKAALAENDAIVKLHPRLTQWNKLSLPPRNPDLKKPGVSVEDQKQLHVSRLKTEYESYLSGLMRRSGMRAETVKVTEEKAASKVGAPPTPAKGIAPVYDRLAFSVSAVGPQEAAYRALREFQAAHVLHEVRGLTLTVPGSKGKDKPDPKTLELSMKVEALVVNGAEERPGMMPKQLAFTPRVLAEPARDYGVLSKRSLFSGLAEPPKPVAKVEPKEEPEEPKVSERQRLETLEFVKLTMLAYNPNRSRWEATLYDQAQGEGNEVRLDTRLFKSFTLYSGETAVLEGKVVLIDEEQLVFTAEGKHFRARLGDFLDVAWKAPLPASEVKKLGL